MIGSAGLDRSDAATKDHAVMCPDRVTVAAFVGFVLLAGTSQGSGVEVAPQMTVLLLA